MTNHIRIEENYYWMQRFYLFLQLIFFFCFVSGAAAQKDILPSEKTTLRYLSENYAYLTNGDSVLIKETSDQQLIYALFRVEQDTIGLDPGLSTDGRWRAIKLMKLFRDIPLALYSSTPFRRNILSLQPLLDDKKAKLVYYDLSDLKDLYVKIDQVYPKSVIMMVHHPSFESIAEHLTETNLETSTKSEPSNILFILRRDKNKKGKIISFYYNNK